MTKTRRLIAAGLLIVLVGVGIGIELWANDYYLHSGYPTTGSPATSSGMRAELSAIAAGFNKLPTLTGNANRAVVVNGSATALTVTPGTLTLMGNLSVHGGHSLNLTTTGSTNLTLPVAGTVATLAGSETLTNKTLSLGSNAITGTVAQFNAALTDDDFVTLTGSETLTNKTLSAPTFTGTAQGVYTLGGSPTLSNATLSGSFSGTYTLNSPTLAGTTTLTGTLAGSSTVSGTLTGGTYVTPEITSGVLTTSTVAADPTAPLGVASKQYVEHHGFTTGDVKLTMKTTPDVGWVLMNDGTIGNEGSGATTRANADTQNLYVLIWNNIVDQWAPVLGGRGASALDDFNANKPIRLPRTLGRALAGYGTGMVTQSGTSVDLDAETFPVPSNTHTWITGMRVTFTLASGSITPLTSGTDYFIIRQSATTVQLASSLANAQNGVAINLTAQSSPNWTLTHTYTARALGETGGEETHAMSASELLAHNHSMPSFWITNGGSSNPSGVGTSSTTSQNTGSTGGNAAMNIVQPTVFFNVMVKL